MTEQRLAYLREKANSLPLCPGVYLMKREDGSILYVGKSRRLKNRVSSYFSRQEMAIKTARMVAQVHDFDYILCESEIEALTLENLLIKKHTPKYNIKLKDAKSYPYLKVTSADYPRILITRDRKSDGGKYFGPYSGMATAKSVLETVTRLFGLPTCRRRFPEDIGRDRPCLYRQMGRCIAPCTGEVGREAYLTAVKNAEQVLAGRTSAAAAHLEERMKEEAAAENFEFAAYYRDSLEALRRLTDKQKVVGESSLNADALALFEGETVSVLSCLSIREGKLQSKNDFLFNPSEMSDGDTLLSFLHGHYRENADIPREILLGFPTSEEDREILSDALSAISSRRVSVRTPERGKGRALCEMAEKNAKERASRYATDTLRDDETLVKLASLLGLEAVPDRIEAYDISNFGNEQITASMAVCLKGKLTPSHYRFFRIDRNRADDYASMREALDRRTAHFGDGTPSFSEIPDLILLDGGVGHVHTIRALFEEKGIDIPVFGMIKDDFHRTRVLTDGEHEIQIIKEQAVFTLIYKIQEEAHRFAVSRMSAAKRKTLKKSPLEDLHGIGRIKAAKLYAAYGSIKRMKEAPLDSLYEVRGITRADAETVYRYLHPEESGNR